MTYSRGASIRRSFHNTENVPLSEDIKTYFESEVRPHVPNVWINTSICDHKVGAIGKVGYDINFNRYFYKYQPPRPLKVIEISGHLRMRLWQC